jgi:glycylpeptide N-tetradecanoyltransferase
MEQKDINDVQRLLDIFLRRYDIAPVFNEEEVKHWFLPIEGVIESFVVEVSFICGFGFSMTTV